MHRFWRSNGPYLGILVVGAFAMIGAWRLGGDGASAVALGLTIAAGLAWGAYDFFCIAPTKDSDPFGRTVWTSLRHEQKAKAARFLYLKWMSATVGNCPRSLWDRFNDALELPPEWIAIDGAVTWLAAERDYFGWPDPPRYVVVGFGAHGEVIAATDLYQWPPCWLSPGGDARQ